MYLCIYGAGGYKILKLMNEVHLVVTTSLFLWFVGCMMAVMWFIVRKLEAGTNFRGLKLPAHNQAPTHSLIGGQDTNFHITGAAQLTLQEAELHRLQVVIQKHFYSDTRSVQTPVGLFAFSFLFKQTLV